MTDKGDSTGDESQVDIKALLAKIEQAERMLSEISKEMRVLAGEGAQAPPADGQIKSLPTLEVVASASGPARPEDYRAPVESLFRLAASQPMDSDELEEALSQILHPSARTTPRAVKMMIRFPWAKFMKSWKQYLKDSADPASFVVERTSPRDIGVALRVKAFVSVSGKHPSPVELARDEGENSAWGIISFSL